MLHRVFVFLLFLMPLMLRSQSFEAGWSGGYSLSHHVEMTHLTHRFVRALMISGYRNTFHSPHPWARAYHYPQLGWGISYQDLGDSRLGYAVSLTFNTKMRLNAYKRKTALYFLFHAGLGWITRPFDEEKNYKNNVLGTHINNAFIFGPSVSFPLSRHWFLNLSGVMYHYSNGSFQKPNLGINMPALLVSMEYKPHPPRTDTVRDRVRMPRIKENYLTFYLKGGIAEKNLLLGRAPVHVMGMQFNKRFSYKHSWNAGIEWMNDYSMKLFVKYRTLAFGMYNGRIPDYHRVGLYAGHQFHFDNFMIITDFGYYIYDRTKVFIPVYYRIGFQYRFFPHWYASFGLKLHLVEAEYLNVGIHYRFDL